MKLIKQNNNYTNMALKEILYLEKYLLIIISKEEEKLKRNLFINKENKKKYRKKDIINGRK